MVSITDPVDEDFSFLENMTIYIQGDSLTEEKVASVSGIDAMADSLTLDLEDVNLAEHLKSGSFIFRAEGLTDEDVTVPVTFKGDFSFAVKADIL
jgi:hypothetical protein